MSAETRQNSDIAACTGDSRLFDIETPAGEDTVLTIGREDSPTVPWPASLGTVCIRAQEAQARPDGQAQDVVRVRADSGRIVFAVCDGVGGSYFGQIAARFLADRLVDWLWDLPPYTTGDSYVESLSDALSAWRKAGQALVDAHALPADLSPRQEASHARWRAGGSQSMFCCGIVWPVPAAPSGEDTVQRSNALVAWLGNVACTAIDTHRGVVLEEPPSQNNGARWSTTYGLIGNLESRVMPAVALNRLVVYTDGIAAAVPGLLIRSPDELEEEIRALRHQRFDDDAALFALWRRHRGIAVSVDADNGAPVLP